MTQDHLKWFVSIFTCFASCFLFMFTYTFRSARATDNAIHLMIVTLTSIAISAYLVPKKESFTYVKAIKYGVVIIIMSLLLQFTFIVFRTK